MRRSMLWFLALASPLALAGCEPLDGGRGAMQFRPAPLPDAIPAAWGRVVAVTPNARNPDLVQIWLEQDDRSLVVVWFDYGRGEINQSVVIPRR